MTEKIVIDNKLSIEQDGEIFVYTIHKGVEVDMDLAEKMVNKGDEIGGKLQACANIIDVRQMSFMSSAVRAFLSKQDRPNLLASAIVINSVVHKGLANLYLNFARPTTPTHIFTDLEKAKEWSAQLLRKKTLNF